MKNLECSSAGDRRFSAFYAYVEVNGFSAPIEYHYQSCKKNIYGLSVPKGAHVDHIIINGKKLPSAFLTPFYKLLWVKYLDAHPKLVKFAQGFNSFSDKFRGKSVNCQADVISEYILNGRNSIMNSKDVQELLKALKKKENSKGN